ncbi:hypothetical protein [Mesobacillus foraminis]|nr:hypothetical protein [Mesobacillus foraminis]
MKQELTYSDHHKRSGAAQVLCSLAKSDPEEESLMILRPLWM